MLTFEEKLEIIESFPELTRNDVSLGRVNFHYEESVMDKKNVVYHLHPNGNGFVFGYYIDGVETDDRGMVNIRDFSREDIKAIVRDAIDSLSQPDQETWVNEEGHTLALVFDFDLWNIYAGDMLDGTFPTYAAATDYLEQEGFNRQ
ncbi:hypothetical protein IMZ31_15860 [Pontibacillus sp. ALD_SL1]|uniref:hypothetical protein n=1 Tax=Pontibacillus sp. ALD_SL1 TaxID=2777185 RepID=UPI001A957C38|nr:hypothetical protein [Pontibacillus sp. ALD_SL1]QSS99532.1 hypothetical protein IMZ31_15860 [Pontibacillus sp. ALD_SL1]